MSGNAICRGVLMLGITLTVILADPSTASAFYWLNWPGGGISDPAPAVAPTVVPQVSFALPTTPNVMTNLSSVGHPQTPVVHNIDPTPVVSDPTPVVTNHDPAPTQTPEPSSLLIGLAGMGALAVLRRLRGK
jgi:MYXO-CTERM domain-containing protein